ILYKVLEILLLLLIFGLTCCRQISCKSLATLAGRLLPINERYLLMKKPPSINIAVFTKNSLFLNKKASGFGTPSINFGVLTARGAMRRALYIKFSAF